MSLLTNNLRSGVLRHHVDLWGPPSSDGKPVKDAAGAIARTSASLVRVDTVSARIEAQSGQARYATEQYVDRMSHVISIRYRHDVAKGMEVRFEGARYLVKYVLDAGKRKRFLHLLCLEIGL